MRILHKNFGDSEKSRTFAIALNRYTRQTL